MRFSQAFAKTRKDTPKDETARNADLLIRAGFVDKLSAGVYTFLPLGLRTIENISGIIRDEMNALGAQELLMPALHPKENWETTGRWDSMDDLYKITDARGRESALGPTHEEVIVPLAQQFIASYRNLPVALYQIQSKFRMELRAKSGLLRGREFLMKDLYSFHADEADLDSYYDTVREAYHRIFARVGIGDRTYLTYASGGTFAKYSHEFQAVTPAGEDTIYICDDCSVAVNEEIREEQEGCPECGTPLAKLRQERAIEVGNIFKLQTKFSEPFNLSFAKEDGTSELVRMGCYGIGVGRLMGAIVDVRADDAGVVWPRSVAPYNVHLIEIPSDDPAVRERAEALAAILEGNGISVLYDDRDVSVGVKFADADIIGIPDVAVVSEKTHKEGEDAVELRDRASGESRLGVTADVIGRVHGTAE